MAGFGHFLNLKLTPALYTIKFFGCYLCYGTVLLYVSKTLKIFIFDIMITLLDIFLKDIIQNAGEKMSEIYQSIIVFINCMIMVNQEQSKCISI